MGVNRQARWLMIGAIVVAAIVAAMTIIPMPPVSGAQWALFGLLLTMAALSYLYPIRLEGGEPISYNLSSAFLFAGAFALPPWLLSKMALLLVVPALVRDWRRDRVLKDAFNAANYLLSAQLAALVLRLGGVGGEHYGPVSLAVTLVAVGAAVGLETVSVAAFLKLNLGTRFWESPVWDPRYLTAELLISAMGALLGIVAALSPWAMLLALIPLLLPYFLLRNIHLVRMVDVDPKTGLYNHRYFQRQLPELLARSRGQERPVAILFADLDFLRSVNNTYGHLAGDRVLGQVAGIFLRHTRPGDLIARWGGEEFVVVLPGSDGAQALGVAERLCAAIRSHSFDIGRSEPIRCTVSIGLASTVEHGWEPTELVHRADEAMYRAKAVGRDRACS